MFQGPGLVRALYLVESGREGDIVCLYLPSLLPGFKVASLVPFNLVGLGQRQVGGPRSDALLFLSFLWMPECLLAHWQDKGQEQELNTSELVN